jgi:outer membrane protein assembly factor BamB
VVTQLQKSSSMFRLPVALLVLLTLASILSGCGSKDEAEELGEPLPLEKFDAKVKFKSQWSRGNGPGQGKRYDRITLGYDSERVYVANVKGRVASYDTNGKSQWRTKLERLSAGVGTGSGLALVATTNGEVVALDASTGEQVWRVDVRGEVLAAPAASGDRVIVQTYDGRVLGLARDSGEQLWVYTSDVPVLTLRGTATPIIEAGIVYTGFASGKLVALDISNGNLVWDKPVAVAKGQAEIDRIVDIDASPLVTNSVVYAASFNGNLFAFSKRDGRPLWRFEISSYREVAEGFGNIYAVDEKSRIFAIEDKSGDQKWEQSALLNRELSAPVVFGGFLILADSKGYIHALSQVDGSIVGRTKIDGSGVRVPMRVVGDSLYVYSNDGKLASYQLQNKN